ncbi:MAG: copper homeostasis protein CutC [Saonia sp.]
MLVEVCANSLESAVNAEKAGADRIELCTELGVGGITPSYGLLQEVRKKISIPVHVLIRPRSGDFNYTDIEFEIMKKDIALCVELGFNGIVSGVLQKDFMPDMERTQKLIHLATPLKFTFHRAFDWVTDPLEALGQLELSGVNYILTSGQQKSAFKGMSLLSELNKKALKCVILPGGGIRGNNVLQFKDRGFKAIHLSGAEHIKTLDQKPKIPMNSPALLQEDAIAMTQTETIRDIVRLVK